MSLDSPLAAGTGNDPSVNAGARLRGLPVFLLHGLLESAPGQFISQIRDWEADRLVIPVDLPGHGGCRVDARSPYIPHAIQYFLGVLGRFGGGHVVAASYLGAPLAVRAALEQPDLVRSLTLTGVAPGVPASVLRGWSAGFENLANARPDLREAYDQVHGKRWRHTLNAFLRDVDEAYEGRVALTNGGLARRRDPTLVINGSARSIEREAAAHPQVLGPSVRGHVVHGAGHLPNQEAPQEFNRVVGSFLAEAEREVGPECMTSGAVT